MSEKYFTGDTIPIGIIVTEGESPLAVSSAVCITYGADGKKICECVCDIGGASNNEVTTLVAKGKTTLEGKHYSYIVCQLPGNRERTYLQETMVYLNPQKVRQ